MTAFLQIEGAKCSEPTSTAVRPTTVLVGIPCRSTRHSNTSPRNRRPFSTRTQIDDSIHGANELEATSRESAWRTLSRSSRTSSFSFSWQARVVSGFLGHTLEAGSHHRHRAVAVSRVQEHRAGRGARSAEGDGGADRARAARRHGIRIPARELVPGDVVMLRAVTSVSRRRPCRAGRQSCRRRSGTHRRVCGGREDDFRTLEDPRPPIGDRTNMTQWHYGRPGPWTGPHRGNRYVD